MGAAQPEALAVYGLWGLAGTVALLGLFAVTRGRVRIEAGWGGWTIPRFGRLDRLVHWVLAVSFMLLALTGFVGRYGQPVLLPWLGADTFANMRAWSGLLHRQAAYPFMAALALAFVLWIRHSLPHWRDPVWLASGGGLLVRRWHPAAWKFNAGQKLYFWAVMLMGLWLSLTGLALLFPFETPLFAKAFALLNGLGLQLPTTLTPAEEAGYASAWHAASALGLACLAIIHIYLRTYGIQGAFAAMGSGEVDVNWARQHHSLWAEAEVRRMEEAPRPDASAAGVAPAE